MVWHGTVGGWAGTDWYPGALAAEEEMSPYPAHAIPVAFSWKKVAVGSRGCVPPKAPAAQTAVRRDGVLSLPRTDNLRTVPMVKF